MRAFLITTLVAGAMFAQNPPEGTVEKTLHFTNTEKTQDLNEIATVVRSIGDIRQISVDSEQKTLTIQGTAAQIELAAWLFGALDLPTPSQEFGTREYRPPNGGDDVVRVFYVAHIEPVQNLQEVATTVRSIGTIRRLFTYNALRAVALRGTAGQIALAGWLLQEFDQPAKDAAKHEFQVAASGDEVVRVFYLPQTETVQRFQKIATEVRSSAQIYRLFTYNAPRAIALRGTPAQVAVADQMIKQQIQ